MNNEVGTTWVVDGSEGVLSSSDGVSVDLVVDVGVVVGDTDVSGVGVGPVGGGSVLVGDVGGVFVG